MSHSLPQIEREVILSGADKDSKIPILHEYKKRPKSATAIAPDAPSRSVAWIEDRKSVSQVENHFVVLTSWYFCSKGQQEKKYLGGLHDMIHEIRAKA